MSDAQLIPAATSTPAQSTVLVKMAIDHLQGGRQFTVVYISPLGEDAPLPPGLAAWPEPGTAVVSPELLREGGEQGISGRYGEITDTIGEPGLADATELLAYVRPAQDYALSQSPDAVAVSGFGGTGPILPFQNPHWLLADQDFFGGGLVAMAVALGVVPSLLLAMVASKVASHSRDRRDALVIALGGRVPHRMWVAAGESWIPVTLGALGAVALIAWFAAADRRLPMVDYVVSAVDVRGQWLAFGLCVAAAAVFVLSAAVLQSAISTLGASGNRPLRRLGERTRTMRAAAFPCFVLLAAFVPYLLPGSPAAYMLIGYVGLVGSVLTMPTAIGVGVGAMGRALARLGHLRREPALLTIGHRMAYRPDAVARQVFGVGACIFFLLFALTIQGNFARTAAEADAFIDEQGYSLVEVHPRGQATRAEVDAFVAAVPKGVEVVAYSEAIDEDGNPGRPNTQIHMTGTCPALELLALPCPAEGQVERVDTAEGALAEWLDSTGPIGASEVTVTSGTPSSTLVDGSISLLAFTSNGEDIAAGVLNNAGTVFAFGVATSAPGESWHTGAVPPREQSGWIALIGGFGLVILILATGLGLASEFLRFGRAIAPLSVLAGSRRIYWRTAALISLLPLTAAVAGGFLLGYAVVRPMAVTGVNLITPAFVAICGVTALVTGMIMWLWSTMAAVGSANRWRPGRGDD